MRERLLLVKMIFAKIAWEGPDSLSQEEVAVLELSWERITAYSDPDWVQNKTREWLVLEDLLVHFRDRTRWFFGTLDISKHAKFLVEKHCLPSAHAYFGWVKSHKISSYLKRTNRDLRRNSPPKRFIGVGYKDTGQCRDVSYDGSPSWQEVASGMPPVRPKPNLVMLGFMPMYSRFAPEKVVFDR